MKAVFRELEATLVWPSERHIIVQVAATPETQSALEDAITKAMPVIEKHAGRRGRDQVVVDAIAVNADGSIVARVGLWSAPSEQSSVTKIIVLALALERGVIRSLEDVVLDRTVRQAVETSHNDTFNTLVERLGPQQVAEALRRLGYSAEVAHPRIGLGGGVTATVPAVARMFGAFGYSKHMGSVVPIRVISEARDAETEETFITASGDRAFSGRVAREVQSALEGVALRGTASKELAQLAAIHAICTKTGTSAYINLEGHLDGRGGSWIVASDSSTGLSLTVRVRWTSGEPFDVLAGDSAAVIARHFIVNTRGLKAHAIGREK
jgi:membrane peptidoglycan carboxypeptidase